MKTIFVQIASYKDPQLIPTVLDLIAQADHPEDLHISIAWQHSESENIDALRVPLPAAIKIIDIPWKNSKGVCWARSLLQRNYNNEEYTLALDSHHRFIKGWDTECISEIKNLQQAGYAKPLLTSYIPSFDPENDPSSRVQSPWKMNFDRFIPEGAIFFLPSTIDNFAQLTQPIPARFFSAHFVFTLGQFCSEVKYDPYYYFHGEEINMAVRSYTWGYDLFHPHRVIAWHEYTRKGRTKHWDDDTFWVARNIASHKRNRQLFGMDGEQPVNLGIYGFGPIRSLDQYERYAGICFSKRAIIGDNTGKPIWPCPVYSSRAEFESHLTAVFRHCIDVHHASVPETDYDFWCVAFKDKEDREMFRQDADSNEIARLLNDPDKYCKIWREFPTTVLPHSWVVWPHSKSKGWQPMIRGSISN